MKWTTVHKAGGDQKFVICNADEGDPGAFMDRSVLESDPHRVLEGMAIAGYAVGATRASSTAAPSIRWRSSGCGMAIRQAESHGLLGMNIGDTHFDFKVEVRLGAGRLRLRRRDGPDRLHRGRARHAASTASVPGADRDCGMRPR